MLVYIVININDLCHEKNVCVGVRERDHIVNYIICTTISLISNMEYEILSKASAHFFIQEPGIFW